MSTIQPPTGYRFIKYKKKDGDRPSDMKDFKHKKGTLYVEQEKKMLYKDPKKARKQESTHIYY